MNSQNNEEIIRNLLRRGTLFCDTDFPCRAKSIKFFADDQDTANDLDWLRPREITESAVFVKDGFSKLCATQGDLGDCWVLSAIACLGNRPDLMSRIIVPGQTMTGEGYCGAFRFRFWIFGREIEVMVDDRLPTKHGVPVYAKPVCEEYWVCLLEKALAKLYGCYEALDGGTQKEALTVFTGGICEVINLSEPGSREPKSLSSLAHLLGAFLSHRCLVGAWEFDGGFGTKYVEKYGPVAAQSHSVTGSHEIDNCGEKINAVRIWNSLSFSREIQSMHLPVVEWFHFVSLDSFKVELVCDKSGECWMDLRDFMKYFCKLSILHMPRLMGIVGQGSPGLFVYGEWLQYDYPDRMLLSEELTLNICDWMIDRFYGMATVMLSLEEPSQRSLPEAKRKYLDKSVYIYRDGVLLLRCVDALQDSPAFVQRFLLPPGRYRILPWHERPILCSSLRFLLRAMVETPR